MNCKNCNTVLDGKSQFCANCGTAIETSPAQNKIMKDIYANISVVAGVISIFTDLFLTTNTVSLILEILAIAFGVTALLTKQDKNKAWLGIIIGGIGIVWALIL